MNLNGGYSFQQGDFTPSRNANVTITQSYIPPLLITASVSINQIVSNFVNGSIYESHLQSTSTLIPPALKLVMPGPITASEPGLPV